MATVSDFPSSVPQAKKSSPWLTYLLIFLVLGGIVYGVYSLVNGQKKDSNENDDVKVTDLNDEEENTEEEEEVEEPETEIEPEDDVDLTDFSDQQQSVGSEGEETEYTLSGITDSQNSGYHRFEFSLTKKEASSVDSDPYVVARYVPSAGAIRVDLNMVTTDSSGIGYQKSRSINKDGIIRLYHNVSSDQTEELYDVGVSSQTSFKLTITPNNNSGLMSWIVTLDVKYPGQSETVSDFGSENFSKDAQTISGANKGEGAKVSSYTYSASSGVLSIVFTVGGNSSKPIPSVTAGYDGSGDLVLRFTSIVSDAIAKKEPSVSLPGGVSMTAEMEDSDTSIYIFDGTSKDFRLSGTTNPNQVMLEIKL